jgi:hypothetical protein
MFTCRSPWLIDNSTPEQSVQQNLLLQLEKSNHGSIDLLTHRLTIGGWEAVQDILPRAATIRLLLSDQPALLPDHVPARQYTLDGSTLMFLADQPAWDRDTHVRTLERFLSLLESPHVAVRHTLEPLQANLYAFYQDQDFRRLGRSAAIIGASRLTREGMYASYALNMLIEADPHPETIKREHMRGLLDEHDSDVIRMLDERVYIIAAHAVTNGN